jgi:diguanylate cyclase (GGDEF)-like protein
VFVLDIDDFKRVNDAFGHAAGDEVLKSFGPRLREGLMLSDTVACLGGDEFAVLCEGLSGENEALQVAERIHKVLSAPFAIGGVPHRIGTSIGVALSGEEGPDDLIAHAEAAMYGAKERARGGVEFFDEEMRERLRRRLNFQTALRDAPELGQLRLATQPIVSLPDQRPVGSEALLRWRHPELGSVSPGEFIPVAEESGAIIELGEWVLTEAFRLAAGFRSDPRARQLLPMHVNISMRQLEYPDFPCAVEEALAETGASALDIALEITEHAFLLDEDGTVDALSELRGMGFRIVVDDFGTGYSSLSHLKRLPLDQMKIDRMFITNLTRAAEDEAIVTSLIAMARAFEIDVVAEGVETREQANRLAELGCWYAQGFLFSEPVSPWEMVSGATIGADQSVSFRPAALNASRFDS